MTRKIGGRPRVLSESQVDQVMRWHYCRISRVALARQLGVSASTIDSTIRRHEGEWKQAPREEELSDESQRAGLTRELAESMAVLLEAMQERLHDRRAPTYDEVEALRRLMRAAKKVTKRYRTMHGMPENYEEAYSAAMWMMDAEESLEPTSALKQAAADAGIGYGERMATFVDWGLKRMGMPVTTGPGAQDGE